jgi:hypothetical protein
MRLLPPKMAQHLYRPKRSKGGEKKTFHLKCRGEGLDVDIGRGGPDAKYPRELELRHGAPVGGRGGVGTPGRLGGGEALFAAGRGFGAGGAHEGGGVERDLVQGLVFRV